MKTKLLKAFTLIELLIVIVIIGILATALIPRVTGMQDRARYARVEKDFRDFNAALFLAQTNTNKNLMSITSHYASFGSCGGQNTYLRDLTGGSACRTSRISALRKIEQAAGMDTGSLSSLETDPRGSPYLLDENEGEYGPTDCRYNTLSTVGPNGKRTSASDDLISFIDARGTNGDNRGINLTSAFCSNSAY